MQLKFFLNKCKLIFCVVLCIISFIIGVGLNLSKSKLDDVGYSCYAVSTKWTSPASVSFSEETEVLYPQISFNNQDIDGYSEREFNLKLGEYFLNHFKDKVAYTGRSVYFHLNSKDYLSVENDYCAGKEWDETCCTINMKTGEVVYLEDLIDINESLIKKIKISGFAKVDLYDDLRQPVDGYAYRQNYLDSISEESLYNRLLMCSEPYNVSMNNKPSFYLEEGKLYFVNLFEWSLYENDIVFYVELDDIEEYLKVKKW